MTLVDDSTIQLHDYDPILMIIGDGKKSKRLRKGVYQIGHFGGSNFLGSHEQYPALSVGPYGVCDSVDQLLKKCPELENSDRQFVVTVNEVRRDEQPPEGGWRWHKWGEYIGDRQPKHEYLYDEKEIDFVLVYHVYENIQ